MGVDRQNCTSRTTSLFGPPIWYEKVTVPNITYSSYSRLRKQCHPVFLTGELLACGVNTVRPIGQHFKGIAKTVLHSVDGGIPSGFQICH